MKSLLESIGGEGAQAWDTLVWAGVGHGSELPAMRRIPAHRRILLEPHPALFSRLASRAAQDGGERLLQAALWSETGRADLHLVSNPVKSSLLRPTGLLARLPNLQALGAVPVSTVDLNTLVGDLEITGSQNLLVLDVAGAEAQILGAASREVFGRFAAILLAPDVGDDYEGAVSAASLVDRLVEIGFDAGRRGDQGGILFERNVRVWELRTEQSALHGQVDELTTQVEQLTARINELVQERDGSAAALAETKAQRDHLVAETSLQHEALRQALEQAELALHSQREADSERLDQLQATLAERDRHLAALAQQLEEQGAQVRHLSEHAADIGGHRDRLAASEAALREQLAASGSALAERDAQLAAVQSQREADAGQLAQVQSILAERDAQLAALQSQHEADAGQLAQVQSVLAEREAQLAALQSQHEADAERLAQAQATLAERDGRVADLQQQVQALESDVKRLSEHASDIGSHRDSLAGELQKLRAELAESARVASIGTKLQMLREADLRDLQQRYDASLEVQARQHDMLMKLGERLSMASSYFHQLAVSKGSDDDIDADAVVEAEAATEIPVQGRDAPAGPDKSSKRKAPTAKATKRKRAAKPAVAPAPRKPAPERGGRRKS